MGATGHVIVGEEKTKKKQKKTKGEIEKREKRVAKAREWRGLTWGRRVRYGRREEIEKKNKNKIEYNNNNNNNNNNNSNNNNKNKSNSNKIK